MRKLMTSIRKHIDGLGIQAHWTMSADAAEYRESLVIEQRLLENPSEANDWLEQQLVVADSQEDILLAEEE